MTADAAPRGGQPEPHCEFCEGGRAAFDGLPAEANPYPEPALPKGQVEYYDDPHGLWSFGHAAELAVPTGRDPGPEEKGALMARKPEDGQR